MNDQQKKEHGKVQRRLLHGQRRHRGLTNAKKEGHGKKAEQPDGGAIQCFCDEENSRHPDKPTQKKSEFFFQKQLKTWVGEQGFVSSKKKMIANQSSLTQAGLIHI